MRDELQVFITLSSEATDAAIAELSDGMLGFFSQAEGELPGLWQIAFRRNDAFVSILTRGDQPGSQSDLSTVSLVLPSLQNQFEPLGSGMIAF